MANDWLEKNLGDLLSFSNGKSSPERADDAPHPVYGSNGIIGYSYSTNSNEKTIVIGRVGTYCGSVYYSPDKVWVTDNAIKAVAKSDNNPQYLYYLLKSLNLNNWREGSGQPLLNQTILKSIDVYTPPIPEQKAIAHILGALDNKIELNRQMNETLEAMAQALFKSWFVDFDPVIDNALLAGKAIPEPLKERAELRQAQLDSGKAQTNSEINDLFPSEFEFTEELGWIPKGWSVDSVDNLIEINPRLTLKKGTLASHADMKALPESGFNIDDVIEKEYSGGTKFQNRDVLFARITPCLENGKTGLVDFLEPGEVGFGSTEFIVLREKDNITMEFVACLARNNKFRLHAIQSMVGSSGRQRVQNSCFSDFYMALPKSSNKVLELFHEMTSVNFEKISIQAKESRTLAKLRETLLPKLMSGELRIPDAEKLVEDI